MSEIWLDTCAIIDILSGDRRLIGYADREMWASALSLVEIAMKVEKKKLSLDMPNEEFHKLVSNSINFRAFSSRDAKKFLQIPKFDDHKDPFARMIIAQVKSADLPLLTCDQMMMKYQEKYEISVNRY